MKCRHHKPGLTANAGKRTSKVSDLKDRRGRTPSSGKGQGLTRIDPTRTLTLRRQQCARVRRAFALLKGRLIRLVVDEDAFGLGWTENSNPEGCNQYTGPGCGVPFRPRDMAEHVANLPVPDHLIPEHVWVGVPKDAVPTIESSGLATEVKGRLAFQAKNRKDSVYVATKEARAAEYAKSYEESATVKIATASLDKSKFFYDPLDVGEHDPLDDPQQIAYRGPIPRSAIHSVTANAFGLATVENAFCPTGPDGGVDPTCPPSTSSASILQRLGAGGRWLKEKTKQLYDVMERRYGRKTAIAVFIAGHVAGLATPLIILPGSTLLGMAPFAALAEVVRGVRKLTSNEGIAGPDPKLVEDVVAEVKRLTKQMAQRFKVVDEPLNRPTANAGRYAFGTSSQKLVAFQQWLAQQVAQTVTSPTEEAAWDQYIQDGYRKGAGRSFDDVRGTNYARGYAADQSTRDFHKGGKEEFLKSSFGQPVAKEKVRLLADRTFDELENVTADMSNRMSRTLADGMVQGRSPHDVAGDLVDDVEFSRARAETVARTELIRAHAEGQLHALEQLGVTEVGVAVEWSTTGDDKVCPACQPLEGVVLTVDEAHGMLPRHPNCVVGNTHVEVIGLLAVMKASYSGVVCDLVTSGGRRLTVTANHLMLSSKGWVFAKDVTEGDYLVCRPGPDGHPVGPDEHQRHPTIRQVFEASVEVAEEGWISETLAMPHHLHGDGQSVDAEIEVVGVKGELWRDRQATAGQQPVQQPLGVGNVTVVEPLSLDRDGSLAEFLERAGTAADRLVSRLDVSDILLARSLRHHQTVGVNLSSSSDSRGLEDSNDRATLQSESLSYGLDAAALQERLDHLVRGVMSKVERITFRHVESLPVYDVSTKSTLYVANGIITSNCRCAWVPANVGEDTKDQKRSVRAIEDAARESEEEMGDGFEIEVSLPRPRSVLNTLDPVGEFNQFLADNAFCPTGEGGGVDPSCSPEKKEDREARKVRIKAERQQLRDRATEAAKEAFGGEVKTERDGGDLEISIEKSGRKVSLLLDPAEKSLYVDFHNVGGSRTELSDKRGGDSSQWTETGKSLREGTVGLLHEFKDFLGKAHLLQLSIEYDTREPRRNRVYGKMLSSMGYREESLGKWVPGEEKPTTNAEWDWYDIADNAFSPAEGLVIQAFCPTGEGGGVDPSCSPKSSADLGREIAAHLATMKAEYAKLYGGGEKMKAAERRKREAAYKEAIAKLDSLYSQERKALKAEEGGKGPVQTPVAQTPTAQTPPSASSTTTKADVAKHVLRIASENYGYVPLEDLHDSLGRPPVADFHKTIEAMRWDGSLSASTFEGRGGVTDRQREVRIPEFGKQEEGSISYIGAVHVGDEALLRRHLGP